MWQVSDLLRAHEYSVGTAGPWLFCVLGSKFSNKTEDARIFVCLCFVFVFFLPVTNYTVI